jgi:predicted nuclease of predicted toxin-antitoxin system
MKIILDNCVNWRLAQFFKRYEARHVRDLGWQDFSNGKLLAAAEQSGFQVLITVDKNMRHQQNLNEFSINLVTLDSASIRLVDLIPLVAGAETEIAALESKNVTGANISIRI